MKKVFLIHGFEGIPNGAWRSWIMSKLAKDDIYACALAMPHPEAPLLNDWIEEIKRHVDQCEDDELYFIGHSLGATGILKFLETYSADKVIEGIILVSCPIKKTFNRKTDSFHENEIDFTSIKSKIKKSVVIHGDNDPYVAIHEHADVSASALGADYIIIENGGHLNGSAGFYELPECLEALRKLFL